MLQQQLLEHVHSLFTEGRGFEFKYVHFKSIVVIIFMNISSAIAFF